MQYSMPSLIASAVVPFHHTGAGSETCTVSWPGVAGAATGIEPLAPFNSQLPIMSAAEAAVPIVQAATAARSKRLAKVMFRALLFVYDDLRLARTATWLSVRAVEHDTAVKRAAL